ncbi:hypothetical protein CsSME_00048851 [Camellia sinensis var. sinensis]
MMATPIDSSISISFLFSAFLFLLLCSLNKGYASSDESTLKNHFHTIQISSLLPASVCSPSTKDHSKGVSLKVVHKHGPCSHLSKEKANAATATQILTRDESRVNSIQSRLSFNLVQKNTLKNSKASIPAKSGSSIGSGNYIVTIGLGTPKKDLSLKTAGAIIDSGTVITRLPPAAYTPLRTAFRQQMKQYPMAQALSILDTCYDLSKYSTVSIPKISFLFGGNIEVPLAANGILYTGSASQVCLAFAGNSAASDVGIFGNVQQQTLNVVYDVAGGKLGFASAGCS